MSPAVIHWGLNHYAAMLEERNGKYHVVDPTFAEDFWMSTVAIDAEASGYFMVPAGDLPTGWRTVTTEEAETVWGRGAVRADKRTRPDAVIAARRKTAPIVAWPPTQPTCIWLV